MLFLNPAVLLGLFAASIPVLIHMLNLRKLRRIDFSTLAFLKELQKNKIRKIKLKQWLLLALRILIILFLVMAFARPTIKGIAIGGTSSAAKTTAVFVLDDTYSMSVVDAKGSLLNQAKSEILELLKQIQEGDDVALVLVSDNSKKEIKTTGNLSDFEKRVGDVTVSSSSGMIHNAIVKAAKILDESKNFNKEIYILSDFQTGRLSGNESLSDLGQILNNKVRIYTIDYSGKEVFNLGIDQFKSENQIFEKGKPVNFNVTLTNYSNQQVKNAVVSLYLNGERSSQQSVTIGPGNSKIISIQAVPKSTGFIDAIAEIEDDDILQDNKRYLNFYIPDKIPVIIFSDDQQDTKYLKLALTAGDDKSLIEITEKNLGQLSSIDLNQFDVVLIVGADKITGIDRLKNYINTGGSLFLMPGENTYGENFNNLLQNLNLPGVSGIFGKNNSTDNSVTFDKTEFNHPIFADIFSNRDKKKIESPDFYHFFKISTQGKGNNIISLMDGSSFLSEYRIGEGKVLLMNTAPLLSWSNLPLKGIFVPLINKSVFYLASKERQNDDYIAGMPVTISLAKQTSAQIKIENPEKREEYITLNKELRNNFIGYDKTNVAGNYKIFSGKNLIDEISVNTDPKESVTKYLSDSDFEDYLNKIDFKGNHIIIKKDQNPADIIMQSRFGSELWKYFILVALILALIEMAVARNAKKELLNVEK
ncbi:MAG: BatA domain-containing protein [Ignavibacteriaceae bacterium]